MAAKKRAAKKKADTAAEPQFTEAQLQVINHKSGPLLTGAVAGAGKSTTLVERVARLVASGSPLHRILLCAFNVDAAADLNRKLKKRLGLRGQDVEVARTLHSIALAVWKSHPSSAAFGLDRGGGTYNRAIRQGARALGYDTARIEVDVVAKFASRVKNDCLINSQILGLRALGKTPSMLVDAAAEAVRKKKDCMMRPETLLDVYFAAEDARTNGTELPDGTYTKFVTFDDTLANAAELLAEDDETRLSWQRRFDHVIVDESQDLCEAQWRIVTAIAEGHENIIVVGDPGQAIYVWRGAKPEHFLNFGSKWRNVQRVYMDANFRSGDDIVRAANIILDKIPESQKLPMTLQPTRGISGFVGLRSTESPHTEAEDIAANIRRHHGSGIEWRDQAILVRRNDQTALLELALLRAKIPARIVRGNSFFASREAKTALSYLRLVAGCADESDFEFAILNPPKYLGRAFVEKISASRAAGIDWIHLMEGHSAVSDPRYAANAHDFMVKIRELRTAHENGATPLQLFTKLSQKMRWDRLIEDDREGSPDNDAAMNFDRVRDFLSDFEDLGTLFDTLRELVAAQRAAASSRNAVAIATAHSAKGLEWPVVYVAGVVNGTWPVNWGDMIDERRVFYVAVTRARDELWLNGYEFKDEAATTEAEKSPYLGELSLSPTDRTGKQLLDSGQMSLLNERNGTQ